MLNNIFSNYLSIANNIFGNYLSIVYILHILAIAPILIYTGLVYINSSNEDFEQQQFRNKIRLLGKYVFMLGLVALLYHSLALWISLYTGTWLWNWDILLRIQK